ncbi:hypothetical protein V5O48_017617 [Marasmius crinis-equi]|uniref:Uncharacterized protein n=1 Tax=Marasmius crinis-equi TaxID=585013 RepID=A0ABR3ENG0_9AGAR
MADSSESEQILQGFRLHYQQFYQSVQAANSFDNPDVFLFQMLGDNLQSFLDIAAEVFLHQNFLSNGIFSSDPWPHLKQNQNVFTNPDEYRQLQTSLQTMILEIRVLRERAEEATHSGRPVLVQQISDGTQGRPSIHINPIFLAWAYTERTTTGIAHFLGVSRSTVHAQLLAHGIVQPGHNPFPEEDSEEEDHTPSASQNEDFLALPVTDPEPHSNPGSSHLSSISDADLDHLLLGLRVHYPRAGAKTLQGMLRSLDHRVGYNCIRQSLSRIDPVHHVFEHIIIR